MSEATPRPWAATTRRGSWDWVVYSVADPNIEICQPFHDGTDDNPTGEANAALIVHAVNNIDRLTAERDELAKLAKQLSDALLKIRPLGGSEMFVRRGEDFYADPDYCGKLIEQLRAENTELTKQHYRSKVALSHGSSSNG